MAKRLTTEIDVDINIMRTVRLRIKHAKDENPLDLFAKHNYSPESYEAVDDAVSRAENSFGEGVADMGFEIVGVRMAK